MYRAITPCPVAMLDTLIVAVGEDNLYTPEEQGLAVHVFFVLMIGGAQVLLEENSSQASVQIQVRHHWPIILD